MIIRELKLSDYSLGFCETLTVLSPCVLSRIDFNYLWYQLLHFQSGIRQTYVAIDNNRIIGTATLLIDQKFARDGGKAGNIEDVAVLPEWQGKGIGKQLIEWIVEKAKEMGCYKIILSCAEKNVGFYEKNGFYRHEITMRIDIGKE